MDPAAPGNMALEGGLVGIVITIFQIGLNLIVLVTSGFLNAFYSGIGGFLQSLTATTM